MFAVVQRITDHLQLAVRERATLFKAVSFALVGFVNTAVDLAVFSLGYYELHLPIVAANMFSWIIAVSGSYLLNSKITFSLDGRQELSVRKYFSFLLAQLAGFAANTATVVIASRFLPVIIGKLLAAGASFIVNFSLSHFVIFRRSTVDV